MVACRNEAEGPCGRHRRTDANPPAGPGMFSSLQLSSITGAEAGTILEMLDAAGNAARPAAAESAPRRPSEPPAAAGRAGPASRRTSRPMRTRCWPANTSAVRSREFSLITMLRQRPDPAVPTRDDNLIDQEVFRHLSMDPRHSRYVMRIVGAPGRRRPRRRSRHSAAPLGSPFGGHFELRPRARSRPVAAQREAIRLGPEALEDVMSSGLRAPGAPSAVGRQRRRHHDERRHVYRRRRQRSGPRTGIYTLKNLLNVSLVAIPGQTSAAVQQALINHCEELRYRFAVLDGPPPPTDHDGRRAGTAAELRHASMRPSTIPG